MTTEIKTNVKQGAAIGGWVCFGLGTVFMFIPVPTWFIYGPLLLVSFILSIIAMSQGRIASGLTLLLANVIGAPILFCIALAIGIHTWTGALTSLDKARQRAAGPQITVATNQLAEASPASTGSDSKLTDEGKAPTAATASEPKAAVESQASPAPAAVEQIEGAFGKKFGEVFDPGDPAQAIGTSKLTDGTPMFEFAPSSGFRSFKRYYVLITPTTHQIYSIWGIGGVESTEAGKKEQAVIMELLKEKYGEGEKQGLVGLFGSLSDAEMIARGNRYIVTKISGFMNAQIEIRYCDKSLTILAEKERLASEVQKADKTGL